MATTGTLGSLVGLASISGFLLTRNIRTSYELSSMSYDDQRNTLIVDFNEVTGNSISSLQSMGDFALSSVGCSNGVSCDFIEIHNQAVPLVIVRHGRKLVGG